MRLNCGTSTVSGKSRILDRYSRIGASGKMQECGFARRNAQFAQERSRSDNLANGLLGLGARVGDGEGAVNLKGRHVLALRPQTQGPHVEAVELAAGKFAGCVGRDAGTNCLALALVLVMGAKQAWTP